MVQPIDADLHRLLGATDLAALLLDRDLRVRLATPRAAEIFDLRPGAVGRPLAECGSRLISMDWLQDLPGAIERAERLERDVWRDDGRRYCLRVVPCHAPGGVVDCLALTFADVTEQRQQEEAEQRSRAEPKGRITERTRQLRELLRRVISVQEDERRRIARDLHDGIGQDMTALHLKLDTARRAQQDAHARALIEEAQAYAAQLGRHLQFLTWGLRPAALDDLGLAAALRDFVAQWSQTYDIAAEFDQAGAEGRRLRPELEINLYRIAQEALNNVQKHARARRVEVLLQHQAGDIVLSIEDDGVGLEGTTPRPGGLGLIGMRERAALVGGTIEFERAAPSGTIVIVRAPSLPED